MKRLCSSDSVAGFMSICQNTTEEHSPRSNNIYSREFQTMLEGLDEEGCIEESGHIPEKKRRLSVEQVKALEKNFEVENKLEPERKVKLAQELGLQPRQVAVWFQNRRARWKTKQLEKDYVVLKTNYDALKLNYETLQHDNEALLKEIRELKSKLQEDSNITKTNNSVQEEETLVPEKDLELTDEPKPSSETNDFNYDRLEDGLKAPPFLDFKDGSSDSDSSAILNEDNCISSGILQSNPSLVMSPTSSPLDFNHCSSSLPSSSMGCFQFQKIYQSQQLSKIEEHNFFSADEACNLFTDEWYSADQWN